MNFEEWLLKEIWPFVKGVIKSWLDTRALVLPATDVAVLSQKFGVPEVVIEQINQQIIGQANAELDKFKP